MTKIETIISEIEHCRECSSVESTWICSKSPAYCSKFTPPKRLNKEKLWGEIPDFCPLEEGK